MLIGAVLVLALATVGGLVALWPPPIIGCIGLIAAVPLTTGLAAPLVSRVPAQLVPDGHGHPHH